MVNDVVAALWSLQELDANAVFNWASTAPWYVQMGTRYVTSGAKVSWLGAGLKWVALERVKERAGWSDVERECRCIATNETHVRDEDNDMAAREGGKGTRDGKISWCMLLSDKETAAEIVDMRDNGIKRLGRKETLTERLKEITKKRDLKGKRPEEPGKRKKKERQKILADPAWR